MSRGASSYINKRQTPNISAAVPVHTPINHCNVENFTASNFSLEKALNRVAHLVNIAQQPVLYVGQGMLAHTSGFAVLKKIRG